MIFGKGTEMKKFFLIVVVLLVLISGCTGGDIPVIDEYIWLLTSVQSAEENGQIIACRPQDSDINESAAVIEMECAAGNGKLTLTDKTNGQVYTGTYSRTGKDLRSAIYAVEIEGLEGVAVSAMTVYHDGSETPTFIVNLHDYALNFFADTETAQ